MAIIDLEFVPGLALPYVSGAESGFTDVDLDPAIGTAWNVLLATFPGLRLIPIFGAQPAAELNDLISAARLSGAEPPDLLSWFAVVSPDDVADDLLAAATALPMIISATLRPRPLPASTISYGTNPFANTTLQIQPAPNGIDAVYAWQVAGGTGGGARLADIESGWNVDHDELVTADINTPDGFHPDTISDDGHGTCVAGIMVGADNGVGTVGLVPDAQLTLVFDDPLVPASTPAQELLSAGIASAAQITRAAGLLGQGGVILIEEALNFFARPPLPSGDPDERPDVFMEFLPSVRLAIRFALSQGVTVIEPAGNGGVDLDKFPALAATRPDAPTPSGAIVVGAGEQTELDWDRTFSSFGSRVDCFAAGSMVRAPSNRAHNAYTLFSGTSSASPIVASAAAAIQAMSLTATGQTLQPADLRRLFRDPTLATPTVSGGKGRIGSMPDLRKICRSLGFPRILPVGAAASADNALVLALLDADDHLVLRHWTSFTLWGAPIALTVANAGFELVASQPAVTSTTETTPTDRLVDDVYVMGPFGIHHLFADSIGAQGDVTSPLSPLSSAAFLAATQGRSVAAARTAATTLALATISPDGRLSVLVGDPDDPGGAVTDPLMLSELGSYRRTPGPVIVSRGEQQADVVAVEDGGSLHWFTGVTDATSGTGWTEGPGDPTSTEFDRGVRPFLLVNGSELLAAAVDLHGRLRVASLDPDLLIFGEPITVDADVTIAGAGTVALAVAGSSVVVLAVDIAGALRVATRPVGGGDWTQLGTVPGLLSLAALGGVVAVGMADVGVMAICVSHSGSVVSAISPNGVLWLPLLPLP